MDRDNNEQTELLRNIWNQIKDLDRNLSQRIDRTNERIDRTNEEVAALRTDVTAIRTDVTAIRTDVTAIRTDVTGLRTDVTGLRTDVDGLKGGLHDLTIEVKAVRFATQSGFDLLARTDARHGRDVDELRSRIERVEEHVGIRPPT